MRSRNNPYLELILALLVWTGVTAVYLADTDVITITDSRWTLYQAISLVRSHDLNLDEYQAVMHPDDEYTLYRTPSHIYSTFPLGTPLLAVPYMAVLDRLAPHVWGIDLYEYALTAKFDAFFSWLEVVWASVIAGATAALIFVLGCHGAHLYVRPNSRKSKIENPTNGRCCWRVSSPSARRPGPRPAAPCGSTGRPCCCSRWRCCSPCWAASGPT